MTTATITASGNEWVRYGETSFVFTDAAFGIVIKLKNVRQDGGYTYGDVYAYQDRDDRFGQTLLLIRPRVNLVTDAGIRGISAALGHQLEGFDWHELFNRVCAVLVTQLHRKGEVTTIQRPKSLAVEELFEGMVPVGYVSGFIAHGGTGKTMTADMLALSLATGRQVGPFKPARSGPVLIADWENDRTIHDIRISRMCDGLGIEMPTNITHYRATSSLVNGEADLTEVIHECGAIATVIDSIGFAAGGELKDTGIGISTMNVVKRLPGTKLMVGHVTKDDARNGDGGKATPIGSVFFFNGLQSLYTIRATEPELDGSFVLVFDQAKANVGRRLSRPLGVRLEFEDPDGPITPRTEEIRGGGPGAETLSLSLKIRDYLGRQGGPATVDEIAAGLGMEDKAESVGRKLREMRQRGGVVAFSGGSGGSGNKATWALAARGDVPPNEMGCSRCSETLEGYDDQGRPMCQEHLK